MFNAKKLSEKAVNSLVGKKTKIDPVTIASIIMAFIELIKSCKNKSVATADGIERLLSAEMDRAFKTQSYEPSKQWRKACEANGVKKDSDQRSSWKAVLITAAASPPEDIDFSMV